MVKIANAKGRRTNQTPSGYTRLFGIPALGNLMSRVQGTVISAGTELEKLIIERCKHIDDLDAFLANNKQSTDPTVWVATKRQVKNSKIIHSKHEPDFLGFRLDKRICYVVEVKDGDQFDTKKASGEHESLHAFSTEVAQALTFSMEVRMCSFNADDVEDVYHGLKRRFDREELLTGRDLCALFGIAYDEIIAARVSDQQANLDYFVSELVKIEAIRYTLEKTLREETEL